MTRWKGNWQKNCLPKQTFYSTNFPFSTYRTPEFTDCYIGRCRNWSVVGRLCSTTARKIFRSSRYSLYLTWCCWNISKFGVESEYQKQKMGKLGPVQNTDCLKLQSLYTQGAAVFGLVCNLSNTNNLPVSNVRHFLHSETSFRKFLLTTWEFKGMKAFARFEIENWCMDIASVDKLEKKPFCKVFINTPRLVWSKNRCKRDEDERFQKDCQSVFDHENRKKVVPRYFGFTRRQSLLELSKRFLLLK